MTAASPTHTHVDKLSVRSGKGSRSRSHSRRRKGSQDSDGVTAISETVGRSSGELTPGGDPSKDNNEEDEARKGSVELIDDEADVDPAPFEFIPYTLAYMPNLKSIHLLESLGGVMSLLKSLGMSQMRG